MTYMKCLPLATFLLAVRVVLSVAELTGDNVCHKRETYTVTMRVLVKEPVQVKSYTWCLKVPPRCTKYKVEMKDKFKIQTEIRERVVDVCCLGYAPDRSETHCIPICSVCLHGVCTTPDTCNCEPGYTGDRCDTECNESLWGSECQQKCQCQNGATCNHVTGECRCADGWRGSLCDVPCPKGTYGHTCLKECDCIPNNNGESSVCHHVTGKCKPNEVEHPEHKNNNEESNNEHLTTVISTLNHETTLTPPKTTTQPDKIVTDNSDISIKPDKDKNEDTSDRNKDEHVTDVTKSIHMNSDVGIALQTTESSVFETENILFPNTEKHTLYLDNKFTTALTTNIPTTAAVITTNSPFITTKEINKETANEIIINSVTITPTTEGIHETNDYLPNEKETNAGDFSEEEQEVEMVKNVDTEQTTEEIGTTEPQNIQLPPRGIIVVSDGLLSERIDDDNNDESRSGIWNLVSSVSVAGGVALALIVMAAITLLVSHRRNKAKVSIAENEAVTFRRQQLGQQQTSVPQMYNYTEDVTTLPLRHLFPDTDFQPPSETPCPDSLQLRFGDVTGTTATNNNLGYSYQPYSNTRAYLELQYDIPPSSISSKTNSLLPGMEPEHLYDEIPCWRSTTTTSTNTDTDTSHC